MRAGKFASGAKCHAPHSTRFAPDPGKSNNRAPQLNARLKCVNVNVSTSSLTTGKIGHIQRSNTLDFTQAPIRLGTLCAGTTPSQIPETRNKVRSAANSGVGTNQNLQFVSTFTIMVHVVKAATHKRSQQERGHPKFAWRCRPVKTA